MLLPKGYREPETVYAVEKHAENGDYHAQLGAFYTEHDARTCIAQLMSTGHTDLVINLIPVHSRVQDWEFDR